MKGHNYVASVKVSLNTLKSAENFCYQQTLIGKAVAEDLKEDDILAFFDEGKQLSCDVDFEDDFEEALCEELSAAIHAGAELSLTLKYVKSA